MVNSHKQDACDTLHNFRNLYIKKNAHQKMSIFYQISDDIIS